MQTNTDVDRLLSEVARLGMRKLVLETDNVGMELTEDLHPGVVMANGNEKEVSLEELKTEILKGDIRWFYHDETYTEKQYKAVPWEDKPEEVEGQTMNGKSYHRTNQIVSVFLTNA